MKVYKCDRCGEVYNPRPSNREPKYKVIKNLFTSATTEMDLCDRCCILLDRFMNPSENEINELIMRKD